jgi:hypothetical protein
MVDIIKEFVQNYAGELIFAALTAIVGFIGTALKKAYEDSNEDKKKREIIANVVKCVEQVYKNIHGTEKLKKAMETASKMLAQKGISITELELMVLIESALCEFNDAFNKASWKEGLEEATSISEESQESEEESEEESEVTVG